MGYHASCTQQSCTSNCCNYYGYCPEDYNSAFYSSYYTQCHYYYSNNASSVFNVGTIVGAVVGGLIVLAIIVVGICHYKRRKDYEQAQQMEIINNGNQNNSN